jgi:hypothetical protein
MVVFVVPSLLHNFVVVVPPYPFPACCSILSRKGWRTCAHCAALEIATTLFKKIQNSCSCKLPLRQVDYLFHIEDETSDLFALDFEEGIRSNTGSNTLSSSSNYWDVESTHFVATSSSIPRFVLTMAIDRLICVTCNVFFRKWYWYWPLLQGHPCREED